MNCASDGQVPPALGGPFDTLLIVVVISGSLSCRCPKFRGLLWGLRPKNRDFKLEMNGVVGGAWIIGQCGEIAQELREKGRKWIVDSR